MFDDSHATPEHEGAAPTQQPPGSLAAAVATAGQFAAQLSAPASHDVSRALSDADEPPAGRDAAYTAAMSVEALALALGAFRPCSRRAAQALTDRLRDGLARDGATEEVVDRRPLALL